MQKHIFPGAELASLGGILRPLARATRFQIYHTEDIGIHCSYPLRAWRERFRAAIPQGRGLGVGDCLNRMRACYPACWEAAIAGRSIGNAELLLTKAGNGARLLDEPWSEKSWRGAAGHNFRSNARRESSFSREIERAGGTAMKLTPWVLSAHGSCDPRWRQRFEHLAFRVAQQLGQDGDRPAYMEFVGPTLMEVAEEAAR
jgi:hypothetical protein